MASELDIVIPVYNEGRNIVATLEALDRALATPARVLLCYDRPDDDTLPAVRANETRFSRLSFAFVANRASGPHAAVMTGFAASTAPFVVVYPADDDFNAGILDRMVAEARRGADIVCASRFMPGGAMVGCPLVKAILVRSASFTLHRLGGLPTHDATSGFRLFSRRVIDGIVVESDRGFTFSIELLVKAHRLGWPVAEVPARWFERKHGTSRFRVLAWLPAYLRWYRYGFATRFLRRPRPPVALDARRPETAR